ncbi:MAG: TlpA family protein disulfide reductase [Thermoflexales bacterium]|nr:TlpA family protein disulfide reductase [Thermoflexales bacterium]
MIATKTTAREARKQQQRAERRKAQVQSVAVIGGLIAIIGLVLALSFSAPTVSVGRAVIGKPISDFSLTDINGVTHKISDYKGRPVLINAWATWCPPCRAEMPDLHAFYLKHQAEGFEMLAINSGESQSVVASFIQQMGFTFPALVDQNKAVLNGLGIDGLPTSILVGRDGTVKYIHVGGLTPEMINTQLAALITQ